MRRSRGLAALTIVGISAVVAMCVYPTEHDSSVHVDLTHIAILLRGNDTAATATAWRISEPPIRSRSRMSFSPGPRVTRASRRSTTLDTS